jgi:hypothetical protein
MVVYKYNRDSLLNLLIVKKVVSFTKWVSDA